MSDDVIMTLKGHRLKEWDLKQVFKLTSDQFKNEFQFNKEILEAKVDKSNIYHDSALIDTRNKAIAAENITVFRKALRELL